MTQCPPFSYNEWRTFFFVVFSMRAGYVAMINSNSFMKREFGKKLIEDFFPRVNLTHVIDTSGAYIPGHGTPTVVLLGINEPPIERTITAILGKRGEPSTPEDPAKGLVWQSILTCLYGENRLDDAFSAVCEDRSERNSGDRLGDLYQSIREDARKGRALCQTPGFVRTLLLRESLGRSLETHGFSDFSLIDPACGCGHLLVDAFKILYLFRKQQCPDHEPPAIAQECLDRITGVDLDPDCCAITRYRLCEAAYEMCGWNLVTLHTNIYTADALIFHRPDKGDEKYAGKYDPYELEEVLRPKAYTAVVANPPYIAANDKEKNEEYRKRYGSAYRRYSLCCPFTELCFGLAVRGSEAQSQPALSYPSEEMLKAYESAFPSVSRLDTETA